MKKPEKIFNEHLAEMQKFASNACASKNFGTIKNPDRMDSRRLTGYLNSFLRARWGRDSSQRRRADAEVLPWGTGAPQANFQGLTWIVFIDDRQPTAVGIRWIAEFNGMPMFYLLYWYAAVSHAHHWMCDPDTGWQHIAELSACVDHPVTRPIAAE